MSRYLLKGCCNCQNVICKDVTITTREFLCAITGEEITYDGLCNHFRINRQAKLILDEFNGVLLTKEELKQ